MPRHVPLELIVADLCEREWRRRHQAQLYDATGSAPPLHHVAERVCPLRLIMPSLLRLLQQYHHRPMDELRPTIRRLVEERDFVDECGDPCIDCEHERLMQAYVDLLVHVLERVRRHNLTHGEWSNAPVTPQMFG
jgi:hypothetical protein